MDHTIVAAPDGGKPGCASAIRDNELVLHYQPQVGCLHGGGDWVSRRWCAGSTPTAGPAAARPLHVPQAENSGQIDELGSLGHAPRRVSSWRAWARCGHSMG
jgi:predicted signal transduction protein with EAL and GGDEF domain